MTDTHAMNPAHSTDCRPWFIAPSWAAVMPLLAHTIATGPDEQRAIAVAELQSLAAGLDAWNEKASSLLPALNSALDCIDDDELLLARGHAVKALRILRGES